MTSQRNNDGALHDASQHQLATDSVGDTKLYCSMPKRSIKVFAAAVNCAAKIGKDIVINARDIVPAGGNERRTPVHSLMLRTFNDTSTNYLLFTFHGPFFEKLHIPNNINAEDICGKISLKSCLAVFRSIRTIERLELSFVQQGPRHVVVFTATCKHGIVKQHMFHYEDAELEHPIIPSSNQNFCVRSAILQDVLGHLHGSEEITLTVRPEGISIGTSVIESGERDAHETNIRTETKIAAEDLERFEVNEDTFDIKDESGYNVSLTFAQKGLKAMLHFCETQGVGQDNVVLMFSNSGQPVLVSTNSEDHLHDQSVSFSSTNPPDETESFHGSLFEAKLTIATILTLDDAASQNTSQEAIGIEPQPINDATTTAVSGINRAASNNTTTEVTSDQRGSRNEERKRMIDRGNDETESTKQPRRLKRGTRPIFSASSSQSSDSDC